MKPQKIDQYYLVEIFDDLNDRYFKGRLPQLPIKFFARKDTIRKFSKRYKIRAILRGYFRYYGQAGDNIVEIGINKNYKNSIEYIRVRRTMLHEMIHYYFFLRRGKTYKQMIAQGDGHTKQFKKKRKNLYKKEARYLKEQSDRAIENSFIDEEK